MRNHIIAFFILVLAATSCGTQKAATQVSAPKVQTTFFNARFGEPISSVERAIKDEYIFHKTDERNVRELYNVPFAGCEWPYVHFSFIESYLHGRNAQRFNGIVFAYESKNRKDAAKRFYEIYQLLSEKYPLVISNYSQADEEYSYTDAVENLVALSLVHDSEEPDI